MNETFFYFIQESLIKLVLDWGSIKFYSTDTRRIFLFFVAKFIFQPNFWTKGGLSKKIATLSGRLKKSCNRVTELKIFLQLHGQLHNVWYLVGPGSSLVTSELVFLMWDGSMANMFIIVNKNLRFDNKKQEQQTNSPSFIESN